jgi:small-conductance mechanosensitive channel
MLLQTWAQVLTQSFQDLWLGIVSFVPNLIVAAVIFILGWIIGAVLGRVVAQIVKSLKVDQVLASTGLDEVLNQAGFKLDSGGFLGALVKWFIIIVFLVAALDVLELTQVNIFLQQVVLLYLPKVIVAVLILLVAAVIAETMRNVVMGAARAAGMQSAHFVGGLTKWAIWIFAILAALDQLAIAPTIVQTFSTSVAIAIALAVGLAFGLGGQEAAGRYIERLRSDIAHRG